MNALDDDGAQAFPSSAYPGMTLRDYLAAKAMQAAIAKHAMPLQEINMVTLANWSYQQADAMLNRRLKR